MMNNVGAGLFLSFSKNVKLITTNIVESKYSESCNKLLTIERSFTQCRKTCLEHILKQVIASIADHFSKVLKISLTA